MTFNFIKDLTESALIRNQQAIKNFTARDMADLIFLYFLGLQVLRSEFESKPFATKYASKTLSWKDIDTFRSSSNDLYLLMFTLFGEHNKSAIKNLKNQDASDILIQNLNFNYSQAKKWLSNVSNGKDANDQDKLFLMKLEAMLKIQIGDYRSVRRLVNEWNDLEKSERQIAMTRLLLAFRARAPKSELLNELEKVAKAQKLEIDVAFNPETDTLEKPKKSIKPIIIGAAIGAGLILNSIKNFVQNTEKHHKSK